MTIPSDMESNEEITQTIIKLEQDALDHWGNGDPSGFLEICATDVVYFDPGQEKRIDGKEELAEYYDLVRDKVSIKRYELINPLVQIIGDAAVLTFNYVSYGGVENEYRWNCTEVYRRKDESWKIIQTHWSFTQGSRA